MRFRHVRCASCQLPFTVIEEGRHSTVQVNRVTWAGRCVCVREAVEPRMCEHLRRTVRDVGAAE